MKVHKIGQITIQLLLAGQILKGLVWDIILHIAVNTLYCKDQFIAGRCTHRLLTLTVYTL